MVHVFSFGIMEDLSSMWGNFTLSEKEDVEVQIGDGCADILEHRGQRLYSNPHDACMEDSSPGCLQGAQGKSVPHGV